ncbi:MAG TPA: hypothetical protein VN419_06720 [Humidesulfovibrio sp.]|nr:hypothetical protein [Humidesulfovibrio sp.]
MKYALDIRKFEIDLYWKRATYYWAFMVTTFVGFSTLSAKDNQAGSQDVLVALSGLGVILSWGWFLANKGSKQWQENWENHVDMLEDDVIGPLYKTVMKRPPARTVAECLSLFFLGPGEFSVSKINQLISFSVFIFWVFLLVKSCGLLSYYADHLIIIWPHVLVVAGFCVLLFVSCKTHVGSHVHMVFRRKTRILVKSADEE